MKSFYVQVPTTKGIFFVDLVFLALLDMGYKRNVDYSPEKPLHLTDDEKVTLEKKLTSDYFRREAVKKVNKMTFDQVFENAVETHFIPFIPNRDVLKTAFDDFRMEGAKVVTQFDEVPFMKIDGFDAEIAVAEAEKKKSDVSKKAAQAILANQSPLVGREA